MQPRTDLAMEAKALYERSAQEQTQLSGVAAREQERHGVRMTVVKITSAEGEQALGKPRGTYITAELEALSRREPGSFSNAVRTVSRALRELLGPCRQALVVGLGNRDITPDAIGPEAVKNLIVTRHLQAGPDEALPGLMRVAACQPGVLGQTGIESLELVKCAMQTAQPDVVIVIDALAAAEPGRLFRTVQLSDSGIVPGSGVGNSRQEFSRRTLGVPVIAVGVPTVVDAISLFRQAELELDVPRGVLVTMQDVDTRVREMGRLVGYSCDLALHRGLSLGEIPAFLSIKVELSLCKLHYVPTGTNRCKQAGVDNDVEMWKSDWCSKVFHTVNRVVNTRIL